MKLGLKLKLAYGVGGVCDNAMYVLSGTYLLLFLTTVAGVNPAAAGTIAALGSIWEALCAPVVGYKSDNAVTRFGKRKPFLLAMAFPAAVVTTLMFTAIDAGPTVKIVYYTVMMLAFWTCFSSFFVPYITWGSELTDDYNERTVLRSIAYVFNQVGMCVGMVLPPIIVDFCVNAGKTQAQSWQTVGLVTGVCGMAALLVCALNIKVDDVKNFVRPPKKKRASLLKIFPSVFGEYLQIFRLKTARVLIAASLTYLIANTTFSSDRVFFMEFNMGLGEKAVSGLLVLITVVGVAAAPFISKLAERFDKKSVMTGIMGVCGAFMAATKLIGAGSMWVLTLVCLLYAVANACYWQLMPAMIYDVCDADELISGEKRAGAIVSLQALSESVSIAVGLQALGMMLEIAGFDSEAAVQTDAALSWVENALVVIPGAAMVLMALIIRKFPVDRKVSGRIRAELARREKGLSEEDKELREIL